MLSNLINQYILASPAGNSCYFFHNVLYFWQNRYFAVIFAFALILISLTLFFTTKFGNIVFAVILFNAIFAINLIILFLCAGIPIFEIKNVWVDTGAYVIILPLFLFPVFQFIWLRRVGGSALVLERVGRLISLGCSVLFLMGLGVIWARPYAGA